MNKTFTLIAPDGKPYSSSIPGMFGGHRGGKVYGRPDCRAALRAIAREGYVKHRVFFLDVSAFLDGAEAAGVQHITFLSVYGIANGIPPEYGPVLRQLTETIASGRNGAVDKITSTPPHTLRNFAHNNANAWREAR